MRHESKLLRPESSESEQETPSRSTINPLPAEVREALDAWLRDPAITQAEADRQVNALLDDLGLRELRVRIGAVCHYHRRMREGDERLRYSRQLAEARIARLDSEPAGRVGRLLIETLRALTFDLASRLQAREREFDDESLPAVINDAGKVTRMVECLERTRKIVARLELKLKRHAAEERKAKAAEKTRSAPP